MTRQQELELLAEWLGVEVSVGDDGKLINVDGYEWNPSPEGNSDDWINMVAGRVDFVNYEEGIEAGIGLRSQYEPYKNQTKLAAMKHAAYQVCLMAAREWKEQQ